MILKSGLGVVHTIYYWSAIVNIAVYCTNFEFFDVECYRDLKMWVRDHTRSLKMVPFKSFGTVSYLPSVVTMAVPFTILEIFSVKE